MEKIKHWKEQINYHTDEAVKYYIKLYELPKEDKVGHEYMNREFNKHMEPINYYLKMLEIVDVSVAMSVMDNLKKQDFWLVVEHSKEQEEEMEGKQCFKTI